MLRLRMLVTETSTAADRLIDQIDRLHSSPRVAQMLLTLTRDVDFEMAQVVECLERDPALSARLLKVVNSSRFGLAHRITSVRHAATYLGRRSLRMTVLTFALVESLTHGAVGSVYSDYWQRALTMATSAELLAKQHPGTNTDDAYTAALLADVGILILAQFESERYTTVYEGNRHGPELVEAEQAEFGFGHTELGARLLERWGVPESLVTAVELHHSQGPFEEPLHLTVHACDLLADAIGVPDSGQVQAATALLQEDFDIDLDGFIDLAMTCKTEIEQNAELFGVNAPSLVNCEELLAEARRVVVDASIETAFEMDTLENAIEDLSS